jgi:hypothetical protein
MAKELRRIPYEELASNLAGVFDRITREHESVLVERQGKAIALVKPVSPAPRRRRRRIATGEQPLAPGPIFTLESAAGSIPLLPTPLDWEEVERLAKEEHVERVVRELRAQ